MPVSTGKRIHVLAHGLLILLVAVVVALLMKSAFGSKLAENTSYVLAPLYPAPSKDRIRVVTIEREALEANHVVSIRELPADYLVELLELIALQRPAVIFLDLEVERALQRTALLNVVQRFQPMADGGGATSEPRVPIYLARGDERVPLEGEARMLAAHYLPNRSPHNFVDNGYPLWSSGDGRQLHAMAAVQLSNVYCRQVHSGCMHPSSPLLGSEPPLFLKWSTTRSATSACNVEDDSLSARIALLALRFKEVLLNLGRYEPYPACPPLPAKTAHTLLSASANQADELREWMENRIVFVGDNTGTDVVTTPAGLEVPGVFLHATAVENLLSIEAGYVTTDPAWLPVALIALAIVFSILALVLEFKYPHGSAFQTVFFFIVAIPTFIVVSVLRAPIGQSLEWAVSLASAFSGALWAERHILHWVLHSRATMQLLPLTTCMGVIALFGSTDTVHADESEELPTTTILGFLKDGTIPLVEALPGSEASAQPKVVQLAKLFCKLQRTAAGIVAKPTESGTGYYVYVKADDGDVRRYVVRASKVLTYTAECLANAGPTVPRNVGGTKYLCETTSQYKALPPHYSDAKCK